MNEQEIIEGLRNAVWEGDVDKAKELAQLAVKEKIDPLEATTQGLVKGIVALGEAFARGEVFLPELVMAADALKAGSAFLDREIEKAGLEKPILGRAVMGTVAGDVHDIGKTLVCTLLSANGFEVFDLGVDVSAEQFVEAAKREQADVVGLSALLTTTMVYMPVVIQALKESGLPVKVMVGGGPVSEYFAEEIGADGYGFDAQKAVEVAKELVGK
jgi:corrinoid protein of di/trimethylamine methyltransferase